VTNVDDSYRLIHDCKQNPISSAIPGAEQHLTDRHVEVGAFGCEGTALWEMGEHLDTRACANAPLSGGSRSTVPKVTIYVPKISLGFERDDDAIT
jgi:hypothetical protein